MVSTSPTFLGISLTSHRHAFSLAAIDESQQIIALSQGNMDDSLSFTAGQVDVIVAVNFPSHPNAGSMASSGFRQTLSPPPPPGRWENLRLVEYELIQAGIHVNRTHSTLENNSPGIRKGFEFHRRLTALGYNPYPSVESRKQVFESHADGYFYTMTGNIPFDADSMEGRLQRQLILYEQDLHVYDPMRFFEEVTRHRLIHSILPIEPIYTANELNALALAQMAWFLFHHPEKTMTLGLPEDGMIYLPETEAFRSPIHQNSLL
jgi:hypothetical protein